MNPKSWTTTWRFTFYMKLTKRSIIKFIADRENGMSWPALSLKYDLSSSNLRFLFKVYELHGLESLFHKISNNHYSPEFKAEICKRILNGESKYSLSVKFGVHVGIICAWFKKYQEKGYNGLIDARGRPRKHMPKKKKTPEQLTDNERKELNELRKRNKQLEMELELTKKLAALVQERIERETGKKQE